MDLDQIAYANYKAMNGELSQDQFERVRSYDYSMTDFADAHRYMDPACRMMRRQASRADVEMAARLLGALGNEVPRAVGGRAPHAMWLLTESVILQSLQGK